MSRYKLIVAYGDDAYYTKLDHKGEKHTAKEWYDIYSQGWDGYNPTEILEFDTAEEMLAATLDPGGFLPRYYQYDDVIDSAWI